MWATDEVAKARRAKRRADAKKAGKEPGRTGLARDAWHLMLTNLDTDQASVSQLASIYRTRWAVEIQFRALKQPDETAPPDTGHERLHRPPPAQSFFQSSHTSLAQLSQ